jgi:hypothetical protein
MKLKSYKHGGVLLVEAQRSLIFLLERFFLKQSIVAINPQKEKNAVASVLPADLPAGLVGSICEMLLCIILLY